MPYVEINRPSDMLNAMRWPTQYAASKLGVSTRAILLFRNNRNMLSAEKLVLLREHFDSWRYRHPVVSFS